MSRYPLTASVPVTDMARAIGFYEGMLGLSPTVKEPDGGRIYACAHGTSLHVYPSPGSAGSAEGTVATWHVGDLEDVVSELNESGVMLELYDRPLPTDERGIAFAGDGKLAWFKDPDGNTFALAQ